MSVNKIENKNKKNKNNDKNGKCEEFGVEVSSREGKNYFYYYLTTNELKKVSYKAFSKGSFPVIANERSSIKIVGLGSQPKKRLKYLLFEADRFQAEGFGNDFVDAFSFIRDAISILAKLKRGFEKVGKLCEINLVLKVLSILLKFQNCMKCGWSLSDFVVALIDFYLLVQDIQDKFKAEMMEELCLATISMLLPNKLFEIVRRISVFSSSKLVDDVSGIHKLFSLVVDGLTYILELLPECAVTTYLCDCLKTLCNFGAHAHLYQMNKFLSEDKIGEKLVKTAYRNKIKEFHSQINHGDFKQWARKSAAVASSYLDFLKLYKRVVAYEECARQEPIGIVFQGPPGCGKSRAMNAVIQSLPWSKYAHQIKDINDGKDFYDMYENETIFYMDDVGQQGISQWRTFINMISEVKYPLDCARAENKDTKYFNSEVILATTNEFMRLNGLVRTDAIRELPALWRRCLVLDFSQVRFDGKYRGEFQWKYYHLDRNEFLVGFPQHIVSEMIKSYSPTFKCVGNDLDLYAWICSIIVELRRINQTRLVNNKLSDSQIEYIREKGGFETEGVFDWNIGGVFSGDSDNNLDERLQQLRDELELDQNPVDGEVLNVRLQNLREEFQQTLSDEDLMRFRDNPMRVFKHVVRDFLTGTFERLKKFLFDCVEFLVNHEILLQVIIYLVGVTISSCIVYYAESKNSSVRQELPGKFKSENAFENMFTKDNLNTYHSSLVRNIKEIVITNSFGNKINVMGLFSGHYVLVPSHAIVSGENNFLTAYHSKKDNHIIYDKLKIEVLYINRSEDVAVVKLPKNVPTLFRKIANGFKKEVDTKYVLLSPFGKVESCVPYKINREEPIVYEIPILGQNVVFGDHFSYTVRGVGLCGSIVVGNGSIRGMHVAGNEVQGIGLAIKWSDDTLVKLRDIFEKDIEVLAFEMSSKIYPNSSIAKLNESLPVSVAHKSNFGTTPLYGIFPVTRFPAELTKYGKCTVKDIAKKSFGLTASVSLNELEFGKKVVRRFLLDSKFRVLDEKEVVSGNVLLAGLNKKSSNGFGCKPLKTDYINFDSGEYCREFREEIQDLEKGILKGEIDWKKFLWVEALKDELRNEEKEGVPRSFRVGTIHHQVLMKKWFGWLVEHLMINRKYNYIMVGINPFIEWPVMYDVLRSCEGVFAGDISQWDGSMNNMVQDAIKDVILEFIPGNERIIPEFLLDQAIRSLVAVQDDLYLTTHSMPSGHYLTAILNSLVNRFYTAMWYEREVGDGNINRFVTNVVDYVYGDDKLVGIRSETPRLNALSMERFFVSLGMGFTDSFKKSIGTPFQSIEEVTFLKRYFRFHDELGRVVCPLELRTLQSGLSFYDRSKDLSIVLRAKVETYQREVYLWPDREQLLTEFWDKLKMRGFQDMILSTTYLRSVYVDPEQVMLELNWGGTQYV